MLHWGCWSEGIPRQGLPPGRYRWSPSLPAWAYVAGYAVYVGGQAIHLWAKGNNRWFAAVVRIQRDRG